jgi:5S rRNA maturation endonuclease (ribonuclease M5)
MLMKKQSPLNDQSKLKILCDDLCDNIEEFFECLDLEYKDSGKMITMSCPIHGGDNIGALNLYTQGDSYRGNWKCRTHNCENVFKSSIIGFTRGVLSNKKYGWSKDGDKTCSFKETVEFISGFLNKNLSDIKISTIARNKSSFTNAIKHINTTAVLQQKKATYPSRAIVRKLLEIPAKYFIDRGFDEKILDHYDIGLCNAPGKEMYNRIVVPIYDNEYRHMIGCSGRSIFEKCEKCKSFHNPEHNCPNAQESWKYSKWKHSANFKSQNSLYNYWFAKQKIMESATAIIVESPGNVWKLEENNIHNSVAIFGASLSDRQKVLLDSSGAMNLILLTDNDEAGRKAAEQIKIKCQNTYKVYIPKFTANDIGEMTSEQIDNEIKSVLEKIQI